MSIGIDDERAGAAAFVPLATRVGTDGPDNLSGTPNDDDLKGLGGNDRLRGGAGDDKLDGGAGNDNLKGQDGDDKLKGRAGNDKLNGGDGEDKLKGQAGDDKLKGKDDDDKLDGGLGDDLLDGGRGADRLKGGDGEDTFAFTKLDGEVDRVSDFEKGGDRLDLSDILDFDAGDDIGDFVRLRRDDGDTRVAVDPDGRRDFEDVARLEDVEVRSLSASELGLPEDAPPPDDVAPPPPPPPVAVGVSAADMLATLVDDGSAAVS